MASSFQLCSEIVQTEFHPQSDFPRDAVKVRRDLRLRYSCCSQATQNTGLTFVGDNQLHYIPHTIKWRTGFREPLYPFSAVCMEGKSAPLCRQATTNLRRYQREWQGVILNLVVEVQIPPDDLIVRVWDPST